MDGIFPVRVAERDVRLPSSTLLNRLNISPQFDVLAGAGRGFRDSATSSFQNPGPRRKPFVVLPHDPGVFGPNTAVLNHWVSVGLSSSIADRHRPLIVQAGQRDCPSSLASTVAAAQLDPVPTRRLPSARERSRCGAPALQD